MALQPSHQRFTTSSAHDPSSPWEPHFSSTMSVILVTPSGTPCFKVCFPLQPQLQHSRCHHRSPLSQSPEGLPQAMQRDLIEKIQHLAPWSHQRAAPWRLYVQKGAFNPQWHAHAWLLYSRYLNSSSHTLIYKVEVPQWLSPFVFWAPFPGILWKTNPGTQWSEFLNLHSLLVACLCRQTYPTVLPLLQSAWSEAQFQKKLLCFGLLLSLHIHVEALPLVLGFGCTASRRWAFCTEHLLQVPGHHLSPLLNSSI